jgi:hypothetical protein
MKKSTILFALLFASAGLFAQSKKTTSASIYLMLPLLQIL